jgi:hypothetical protein
MTIVIEPIAIVVKYMIVIVECESSEKYNGQQGWRQIH